MYKLLKAAWYKLYVFMRRRDQFESVALREFFRQRYDIDVGMYSYGCFDRWRMPGPMSIGRYCSFASTVRVVPESHPLDAISTHPALYDRSFGVLTEAMKRPLRLTVGDDVWVGHNAVILPGCKNIGRGAVIGAGSIVTRDVAPYTIIAGNPARTLRERFDPGLIVAIEESEWWLLDMNKLADLTRTHPGMLSRPTVAQLTSWRALEAERSTADAEVPT